MSQAQKQYSTRQAAEKLHITISAVMKAIRSKSIKAEKFGWVWMIPAAEVNNLRELLEQNRK